ncbi:WAT1-related protein At3g28050-like [Punica granatum]|uniref:WAT1-related protein n=2 Tax=Punica granatum TaxID=22663 RepID=A0A218XXE7_PUNGR|nr:WAT1-related protein At3g28050-like [Punica granatum]OWM89624.1 hypothetical protein CDL15_Pgr024372 [Punica granatum]PKI47248.1 hypothetical protein CRG98_032385 [Punica granatum]
MVFPGSSGVTLAMVMAEFLEQGLSTLSKAAMTRGMSNFVFVVYSNFVAFFVLLPSCVFFYRKRPLPKLTLPVFSKIFLLAFLGCCLQLSLYAGIAYSSPTLGSVMTDLTPAFTFILAIFSRMETLDLRVQSSLAKFTGTMVSITGALIVTLYKGFPIMNTSTSTTLQLVSPSEKSWIIGGFLLACSAFFLSLLIIVQTWIIRDYPSELMMAFIGCIIVTFESAGVALIAERGRPGAWTLKPDIELIAVVCQAVLGVGLRNIITTWACKMKGPLFVSMFKPIGMIAASLMGVSLLGDTLYLGSVIGGIVIVLGFYSVLWGKAQEDKLEEKSSPREPLLQKKHFDI